MLHKTDKNPNAATSRVAITNRWEEDPNFTKDVLPDIIRKQQQVIENGIRKKSLLLNMLSCLY